jgi:hypothetical protein
MPEASIGMTRAHAGESIDAVIRRADRAMFAVKREHQIRDALTGA